MLEVNGYKDKAAIRAYEASMVSKQRAQRKYTRMGTGTKLPLLKTGNARRRGVGCWPPSLRLWYPSGNSSSSSSSGSGNNGSSNSTLVDATEQ